jgi:hypothetical protein
MAEPNPYAAPQSKEPSRKDDDRGWCCRSGSYLVIKSGTRLPDRCVYCNSPVGDYRKSYSAFWVGIVYPAFRSIDFTYSICSRHRISWWIQAAASAAIVVIYFGLSFVGYAFGVSTYDLIFFVTAFGLALVLVQRVSNLRFLWNEGWLSVTRVRNGCIWAENAGEPFLDSLDDYVE